MNWYLTVLRKYVDFEGRARRKEFWIFDLVSLIILAILYFIDGAIRPGSDTRILSTAYSLAVFVPGLAVSVRRLHDIGRSGWWYLIVVIPVIGWIAFLIWMIRDSQTATNKWGPNPKLATA